MLAARGLAGRPPSTSAAEAKRTIGAVVQDVAGQLGNTPAICQIHPRVLDAYRDGSPIRAHEHAVPRIRGLDREEVPLLRLLSTEAGHAAGVRRGSRRAGGSGDRSGEVGSATRPRGPSGPPRRSVRHADHSGSRCRVPT